MKTLKTIKNIIILLLIGWVLFMGTKVANKYVDSSDVKVFNRDTTIVISRDTTIYQINNNTKIYPKSEVAIEYRYKDIDTAKLLREYFMARNYKRVYADSNISVTVYDSISENKLRKQYIKYESHIPQITMKITERIVPKYTLFGTMDYVRDSVGGNFYVGMGLVKEDLQFNIGISPLNGGIKFGLGHKLFRKY